MKTNNNVVFLRGEKTILRPIDESDLPTVLRWINDKDVIFYLQAYLPKTMLQEKEWLQKLKDKNDDIVFVICLSSGKPIGMMGIHKIDWKDRTATTGAFIGEKAYWNKGYGTDAKMQVLNYAFNTLNLRKIMSDVITYNGRSLAYSKHCGFVVEGVRRKQMFKNGEYWDKIELGLFKDEWLPFWKKYQKGRKK